MNLIHGRLMDETQADVYLSRLADDILMTRQREGISFEQVVNACDQVAQSLDEATYVPMLMAMNMTEEKAQRELAMAKTMLSRPYLLQRMQVELNNLEEMVYTPVDCNTSVRQRRMPLGVLMHIVAGNVDALPVFSVIEGLLTGNINVVKLPGADNGLSIQFLQKLIEAEPQLTDYIYVFDYPSEKVDAMQTMADVSDAIVVWGGDRAVQAVRQMAGTNTRIIEWGHKISFAYVSGDVDDEALAGIAYNICDTNQLYCNSCQGIYVDTENVDALDAFADRFATILDRVASEMPDQRDVFLHAQKTLESYVEQLESIHLDKQVIRRSHANVFVYRDSDLTPSYMHRQCWIKPLPQNQINPVLSRYKNHLQTVGLECVPSERAVLEELFAKTGVVRITTGRTMSVNYCGIPHDGVAALQQYMKIVSFQ